MKRVTEKELRRQTLKLAADARGKIEAANLRITAFEEVARLFNLEIDFTDFDDDSDGSYLKNRRKVLINPNKRGQERLNFTFCHELCHSLIEDNDDLLSDFADAYIDSPDDTMERLCNAGAAELLIPSEDVHRFISKKGFSASLIPELCEQFPASSIAIAYQVLSCASHQCYLIIAERHLIHVYNNGPLIPSIDETGNIEERLVVLYSGRSLTAKYPIKRNIILPHNHALQASVSQPSVALRLHAKLPIGQGWSVPCDMIYFQDKVFAFFHRTPPPSPINPDQLSFL